MLTKEKEEVSANFHEKFKEGGGGMREEESGWCVR